jgi:hypothetical protein
MKMHVARKVLIRKFHDLATLALIPASADDSSRQLISVIVTQILEDARSSEDQRLFIKLHPKEKFPK